MTITSQRESDKCLDPKSCEGGVCLKRLIAEREEKNLQDGMYADYKNGVGVKAVADAIQMAAEVCDGDMGLFNSLLELVRQRYY